MISQEKVLKQVIDAVSVLGMDQLLEKIDRIVEEATGADSTGIYVLDKQTDSVVLRASKLNFDVVNDLTMKTGEGITGWVAKHGKTVNIEKEAYSDSRFKRIPELPDDLYESFLSVPIKSGEVILGVINVKHREPRKYTGTEIELVETVSKLVGGAVEREMLLSETENLRQALETREALGKAKAILMKKEGLNENDAYHYIRKQAMNRRVTIQNISERIVDAGGSALG